MFRLILSKNLFSTLLVTLLLVMILSLFLFYFIYFFIAWPDKANLENWDPPNSATLVSLEFKVKTLFGQMIWSDNCSHCTLWYMNLSQNAGSAKRWLLQDWAEKKLFLKTANPHPRQESSMCSCSFHNLNKCFICLCNFKCQIEFEKLNLDCFWHKKNYTNYKCTKRRNEIIKMLL